MPEPHSSVDKRSPAKERYRDYRSRSKSRSNWSGSPAPQKYHKKMRGRRSYSRSRSRSPSPYRRSSRRRTPSRSPYRRVSHGNRENPQQSRCIGIFGLNIATNEHDIRDIFEKYGPIDRVNLVIDVKSGRSRGFCFVYFENIADAKCAKENCSGMEIAGRRIRVDYSITSRAHTPTPGVYMGRPTRTLTREGSYSSYNQSQRRRSPPSPYYRDRRRRYRSRSRSRSRSYSPRRYR